MAPSKIDTVRTYWDASARGDYEAAGRCIGDGYVWIDHTKEVVARTPAQLSQAMEEDSAWSDRHFEIEQVLETVDGALVVQSRMSGMLLGPWRSVDGGGRRVSHSVCTIFRFDDECRIVYEEAYSDALTLMAQLGAVSG